jgi:hypothetical protein
MNSEMRGAMIATKKLRIAPQSSKKCLLAHFQHLGDGII